MTQIADNLKGVKAAIAEAAHAANRAPGAVTLVAVSKTFPAEAARAAIDAGQRVFGENRVQEALEKWPELKAAHPDHRLHLIGPLQTNKVNRAVGLFDAIETVDREKLARALKREMDAQGRTLDLFVQVNTGKEEQKAGVLPEDIDDFIQLCRDDIGLKITGLMCIPPQGDEAALHFALLAEMAKRNGIEHLSMGMSHDFETAVRFGATFVRVGTAIFGARG